MIELKNNIMEYLFIPHQQALDLKELGFKEDCLQYVWQSIIPSKESNLKDLIDDDYKGLPIYSQAIKFFRDKGYAIMDKINEEDKIMYAKDIIHIDTKKIYKGTRFNSYEESDLECLKQLIELEKK